MSDLDNKELQLPYHTKAVLFDLDDTLHHRSKAFRNWAQSFAHRYQQNDPNLHQQLVEAIVGLDQHGYASREALFGELKRTYPFLHDTVADMIDAYRHEVIEYVVLEREIKLLMHGLRDAHIPFGIVTNGVTNQQKRKIARLGLDTFTTCIFISEEFGAAKPDPSIFQAAAECLETAPTEILFVGDHPRLDMWGAHMLGMKTVWVHHNERKWPDDIPHDAVNITVSSFAELLPIFGLTADLGAETDDDTH